MFGLDGCCPPMMVLTLLDRILALSFSKQTDRRRRHTFNNSSGEYPANGAANLDTCFSVSLFLTLSNDQILTMRMGEIDSLDQ